MMGFEETDRSRDDRLLAIVEYSDEAIIAATLDGRIKSWNPAAEKIFGYASDEIIGNSNELLTPRDRRNEMMAIRVKVRAGQSVEHLQTMRVCKDGRVLAVSLSVSPIHNSDGVVVGTSTIARDVPEVRRDFDAAQSMIEASLDALVAISPDGKITDANQATVNLTGVLRGELIGTSFSKYFTDPVKAEEIYRLVFAGGVAVDYPLTLCQRDGREALTEVLCNASVYRDADGKVLGVFAAAREVTEQVKAQRDSVERRSMELERLTELERFQRLVIGRGLKMMELKKEIENLKKLDQIDGRERGEWR